MTGLRAAAPAGPQDRAGGGRPLGPRPRLAAPPFCLRAVLAALEPSGTTPSTGSALPTTRSCHSKFAAADPQRCPGARWDARRARACPRSSPEDQGGGGRQLWPRRAPPAERPRLGRFLRGKEVPAGHPAVRLLEHLRVYGSNTIDSAGPKRRGSAICPSHGHPRASSACTFRPRGRYQFGRGVTRRSPSRGRPRARLRRSGSPS